MVYQAIYDTDIFADAMPLWAWSLMVCYGLVLGTDVAGHSYSVMWLD